jgi:uncharacterized protein
LEHSNALINESSPYLLQHAHNPVNWYPWSDEALNRARAEDKPILVSIGYAACHWCHVMEKESFENEQIARIMNDNFINIKIDREERPDLDHIYMDAVQAIAGQGGWPLNVFLTPDCKPFYGGTYFPPVRAYNRISWPELLNSVATLFKEKREEVEAQANELTTYIGSSSKITSKFKIEGVNEGEIFNANHLHQIYEQLMQQADRSWGGFGKAPKFPQTFSIRFLLRYYFSTDNNNALNHACLSLDKMISGGIYDHLGGGFARYSTDDEWLAPHFEKMLYDNALLISTLADAYKITHNGLYQRTIRETITFIDREMTSPEGGFYSALDADSEGEEGKFYVWDYNEVAEILGADSSLFCDFYDITPNGNWEQKNILRTKVLLEDFAKIRSLKPDDLELFLAQCRNKLLEQRAKRVRPSLDDKILLGWNALMITALCAAYEALGEDEYRQKAVRNFDFLWTRFKNPDTTGFFHTYKDQKAKYPAFLDDYAYLIEAAICLQHVTSDTTYLLKARDLTQHVLENFFDEQESMFFYTHRGQQDVIVRKKEIYDAATPSGNAVMAFNLYYLTIIFNQPRYGNKSWMDISTEMISSLIPILVKYPVSFGYWANMILVLALGKIEVAIVGDEYQHFRDNLLKSYLPGTVLQSSSTGNPCFPLLRGRAAANETLIYICKNYTCAAPIKDLQKSLETLHTSFKIH